MSAQANGAFSLGNDVAAWPGAWAKRIQRDFDWRCTVATPGPLTLNLTAFGEVEIGQALTRRGTRVINDIHVSGTIGAAALGSKVLKGELTPGKNEDAELLIDCYRCAQSRMKSGPRFGFRMKSGKQLVLCNWDFTIFSLSGSCYPNASV